MTVLAHMAVGGAVGSFVDGRSAPFAMGLASHVLLDVIPHYEFDKVWVEAGIAVGVLGSMLALGYGGTAVFWGALGGAVPDIENFLWRRGILPERWKVFPGHTRWLARFLPHGRSLSVRRAWWQVVLVAASAAVWVHGLARAGG